MPSWTCTGSPTPPARSTSPPWHFWAPRLWIPNRVGEEFYDRRTTVIAERQGIRNVIADQVAKPIRDLMVIAARHAQRHGLDHDLAAAAVRDGVHAALDPVIHEIEGTVGGITIDPDAHPDSDPILTQLDELFDGKTGAAFSDKDAAAAQREHSIRLAGHIPPGYSDAGKGERAIGDFLVWKQTINEATERGLPVLLVTNETKPDWVFRDGPYTMPRVELVREMKQKAGCDFHLVDVQTYLSLAKKYLAAQVSEAAVDEAARISEVAGAALQREASAAAPDSPSVSLDPAADIRRTLASFDASAGLRKVTTPAPGSNPAPKVLPSKSPQKKAASAAKKPKAVKKRAAGDKVAE
ncbi:PIN-like domain-containing protein [Nocardia fluminea]